MGFISSGTTSALGTQTWGSWSKMLSWTIWFSIYLSKATREMADSLFSMSCLFICLGFSSFDRFCSERPENQMCLDDDVFGENIFPKLIGNLRKVLIEDNESFSEQKRSKAYFSKTDNCSKIQRITFSPYHLASMFHLWNWILSRKLPVSDRIAFPDSLDVFYKYLKKSDRDHVSCYFRFNDTCGRPGVYEDEYPIIFAIKNYTNITRDDPQETKIDM